MSTSRPLPKFDAAHFATLSHEEKLELLNHFLDALDRSTAARNGGAEAVAPRPPRLAKTSN